MRARSACMSARPSARGSKKPRRCSTMSRSASARSFRRDELGSIVDNIGLPVSGTNRAYLNTGGVGPEDGDILITLNEGPCRHRRLCEDVAHRAAAILSRLDLLLPARRHRQPDSEFRLAGADRCAGGGPRQEQGRSLCDRTRQAGSRRFRARRMCGCSNLRIIRNSASMWTAPAPA